MEEPWLQLLRYWQTHELRHALTIPFLIGALRKPPGTTANHKQSGFDKIAALIDSVRRHRANEYYHLVYRCPDLRQLVLRQVKDSLPPPGAVQIPPTSGATACSLYALDGITRLASSPFESLVATLWSETGESILNGLFSFRGGAFCSFNAQELRMIESALA